MMAKEYVHLDDAGLALGLSLGRGGGGGASEAAHHSTRGQLSSPRPLEPSLTLSMPDEATGTGTGTASGGGGGGGAHSVSSLSVAGVKRERVEDAEAERASSTAAARAGAGADDDDDGSTRKKLRLTKEQSALLEDRFKEHSTLNPKQKVALAKQLNLRPRQVEVWFQNRRARTKLKQTEVDCEFLKRCCETLTEENRRLQRELQELRALKFAPPPSTTAPAAAVTAAPFYMQLPAATLTLCPSCERLGGPATAAAKADPDRPKAGPGPGRTTHHFFNPFTHSAAC
ncbi:homeobox-leucine zipper protein HOX19-like isoform X2 [Phragmites australis]|uniref:homeobox-leucine zipper protein HOX19-like isoform X2 n=1 Tax=Phragmites australis TaxID=29695 RepID=UPI002D778AD9|nr:homeobox-leucine zipper protein HOX19-like isoform X2 [Phragmites australis]